MKAQMTKVPGYKNVVILKEGGKFFSAISDSTGTEIIPGNGGAKPTAYDSLDTALAFWSARLNSTPATPKFKVGEVITFAAGICTYTVRVVAVRPWKLDVEVLSNGSWFGGHELRCSAGTRSPHAWYYDTFIDPIQFERNLNPKWLNAAFVLNTDGTKLGTIFRVEGDKVTVYSKGKPTIHSAKQLDAENRLQKKLAVDPKYL